MQEPNKTLDDYLSSIYIMSNSHSTMTSYKLSIVNQHKVGFRDFLEQKYGINELELVEKINKEEQDVYKILNEFVVFLAKKEYKPRSIQSRITATKGYLRSLGVKISTDECKHLVRMPKILRHKEEPITKDMLLRLLRNVPPKMQTIILVLSSSGMRIGELVQLRLSDIDLTQTPTRIRIRAETTKTREERETFITKEATNALKDYLVRFFEWKEEQSNSSLKNTLIFGRTSIVRRGKDKPKSPKKPSHLLNSSVLMKSLSYSLERMPEMDEKNANGRRIIHFHGFRKYFRTTVGNVCGRDFAEALIGHGFYMDTYYVLSDEQKKELYLKAEPYLTISDFKAVEGNMKTMTENYQKLEKKFDDFMHYLMTNSISLTSTQ